MICDICGSDMDVVQVDNLHVTGNVCKACIYPETPKICKLCGNNGGHKYECLIFGARQILERDDDAAFRRQYSKLHEVVGF